MESKVCTSCNVAKSVGEFHHFGKDGSRIGKWCEACYSKKIAGRPKAPPEQSPTKRS